MRLLFAIITGRAPSMLELVDRPTAYDDVGHLCRWGMVIHELKDYEAEMGLLKPRPPAWERKSIDEHVIERTKAREQHLLELDSVNAAMRHDHGVAVGKRGDVVRPPATTRSSVRGGNGRARSRRSGDTPGRLMPPRPTQYLDRRGTSLLPPKPSGDRRRRERRRNRYAIPFPDRRLTRSAYE